MTTHRCRRTNRCTQAADGCVFEMDAVHRRLGERWRSGPESIGFAFQVVLKGSHVEHPCRAAMDAAQLHVGSPLSLSQWLADWPLQRKRHEFELVEPKRVSLRVPFAETESRPRELGPARMARRYGGSNLQGQVGHQRAFRPRRASHGSPCRWLGRRDAISCPAVAVRQRATDARSVGSIVRARYIQEFALRLMSRGPGPTWVQRWVSPGVKSTTKSYALGRFQDPESASAEMTEADSVICFDASNSSADAGFGTSVRAGGHIDRPTIRREATTRRPDQNWVH